MIDNVLKKVLELDIRETQILDEYTYDLYRTLVIELIKIKCNLSESYTLSCKRLIRRLLSDYRLKEFLVANRLVDSIEEVIKI